MPRFAIRVYLTQPLYGKYSTSIFSSVATTVSISTLFYASWRGIVSTLAKSRSPVFFDSRS